MLADIGASPHIALAADAATTMAVDAAHASVLALATWAGERLAAVQAIDPESYTTMRGTLDEVLTALQGVIDSQVRRSVGAGQQPANIPPISPIHTA